MKEAPPLTNPNSEDMETKTFLRWGLLPMECVGIAGRGPGCGWTGKRRLRKGGYFSAMTRRPCPRCDALVGFRVRLPKHFGELRFIAPESKGGKV